MITIATNEAPIGAQGALGEMFRQRKAVFVDRLGWKLRVSGGCEIDAYDGPDAVYLLSMTGARLASSVRLLPTLKPHLMSDLFPALCPAGVPRGPAIWEASRFCVDPGIDDREERRGQLWRIIAGIHEVALASGIGTVTFVAGKALLPLAIDAGWTARLLGPSLEDGDDEIAAVAADITADGLAAVCRRHGMVRPVTAAAASRAAA